MKFLSIDIETTGLDPDRHQILEVGAVLDDLTDPQPLDELPTFHAYLPSPDGQYHGDAYALAMNAAILKRLHDRPAGYRYLPADNLGQVLGTWLAEQGVEKITLAGKNVASFDLQFLRRTGTWDWVNHRHRTLDPGPLYLEPGRDDAVPNLAACLERAGEDPALVTHNAVDDALAVVRALRHAYREGGRWTS